MSALLISGRHPETNSKKNQPAEQIPVGCPAGKDRQVIDDD